MLYLKIVIIVNKTCKIVVFSQTAKEIYNIKRQQKNVQNKSFCTLCLIRYYLLFPFADVVGHQFLEELISVDAADLTSGVVVIRDICGIL